MLGAGLENGFIGTNSFDDLLALIDGERERFLGVDVFPGVGGADVDECVPMIGRAVDDDVDVFAFEDFSEIGSGEWGVAVLGVAFGLAFHVGLLDVAEGDDVGEASSVLEVGSAHAAAADESDAGTVVGGARGSAGWFGGERELTLNVPKGQTGRRRGGAASAQERTAGDMESVWHG